MKRLVAVLVFLLAGADAPPADAAFPGKNGKIVFERLVGSCNSSCDREIFTINPDGTGLTRLTFNTGNDLLPRWSPDGKKILFVRGSNYVMNSDGSNQTPLSLPGTDTDLSWSPDGQRLAFIGHAPDHLLGLYTANLDGTGEQSLGFYCAPSAGDCRGPGETVWSPDGGKIALTTNQLSGGDIGTINVDSTGFMSLTDDSAINGGPDWSPDGGRIAFNTARFTGTVDIAVMNRDGTQITPLTQGFPESYAPAWSPDGSKIALVRSGELYTMNADGTALTPLTTGFTDSSPDWQPLPINSYPRPKGATPVLVGLTIAYKPCTAPDREHNPPISAPSCSRHQMTSDYLTVGTGDANGMLPRSEGSVRYDAVLDKPSTPADEADVKLQLSMTDVFTKALADYAGELNATVSVQLTDKDNTPTPGGPGAPGAATTQEFPLSFFASCTPTDDTTVGSVCSAATTADALIPGMVKGGYRSIWQLGQVKVFDGGADSAAATIADNTLFADEGIFAP